MIRAIITLNLQYIMNISLLNKIVNLNNTKYVPQANSLF